MTEEFKPNIFQAAGLVFEIDLEQKKRQAIEDAKAKKQQFIEAIDKFVEEHANRFVSQIEDFGFIVVKEDDEKLGFPKIREFQHVEEVVNHLKDKHFLLLNGGKLHPLVPMDEKKKGASATADDEKKDPELKAIPESEVPDHLKYLKKELHEYIKLQGEEKKEEFLKYRNALEDYVIKHHKSIMRVIRRGAKYKLGLDCPKFPEEMLGYLVSWFWGRYQPFMLVTDFYPELFILIPMGKNLIHSVGFVEDGKPIPNKQQ